MLTPLRNFHCLLLLISGVIVSGCSVLGIQDDSTSYLRATDAPNLIDSFGVAPVSTAVYPLPAANATSNPASVRPVPQLLKNGSFKMPQPIELQPNELLVSTPAAVLSVSIGKPSEPRTLTDINGVINLKVDGDETLIKAQLQRALTRAAITLVDTNLLSVGKLVINTNGATYTLRLTHTGLSSIMTLQDRNGLLVPAGQAQPIFDAVILFWKDPA